MAAAVAVGLGLLAAAAWVGGEHRWDGRVVFTLTGTHGIHTGDAIAAVPLALGLGLAWWCLRRAR